MSDTAISTLSNTLQRIHLLQSVLSLLDWDEQVNLPPASSEQRAQQYALLAEMTHQAASDPSLGQQLDAIDASSIALSEDDRVLLREARRDYARATRLPSDFVAAKAALDSHAFIAWQQARQDADFDRFAPYLEQQIAMAQREAEFAGASDRPYDYFLDIYNPGMVEADIRPLFDELRDGLLPFVREVLDALPDDDRHGNALAGFGVDAQETLLREVTATLGFDYARGRIDVAAHPFCSGNGADTRLTTRYKAGQPLSSLFSAVHEAGHGMYEQGLPRQWLGTPLGEHAGMAMHESQSRLWENQVARSQGFWRFFAPRLRALRPAAQAAELNDETLYRLVNRVRVTPIRVDADEVTYNLHILLRFELERRLFAGDVAVDELPTLWSALSREYLGETPNNDAEGVLQDVHWSRGKFGYFPSYTLGNMIAAQLWDAARDSMPDLESDFARGDFNRLRDWLCQQVHSQGRRYDTQALVQLATGHPLSAEPLLEYLRQRYGALYLAGA